MPLEEILRLSFQYGLAAVVCIVILFKFFNYLERDKNDSNNRETQLMTYINVHAVSLQDTIKDHKLETKSTFEALKEANKYQREEHKEMTNVLQQLAKTLAVIADQIHIR